MTVVYDSADPAHPNLPQLDIFDDSSFEEYNFSEGETSDFSSVSGTSSGSDDDAMDAAADGTAAAGTTTRHRKVSFFGNGSAVSLVPHALGSSVANFVHGSTGRTSGRQVPSRAAQAAPARGPVVGDQGQVLPVLPPVQDKVFTGAPAKGVPPAAIAAPVQPPDVAARQRRRARKYYDSKTSSSSARLRANWEPGITPTTNVSLHSVGSAITVTDYSEGRYRVEHLEMPTLDSSTEKGNGSDADGDGSGDADDPALLALVSRIKKTGEQLDKILRERPEWAKVRWINVNGLSWEAISIVSLHFQLHRLSIEDMVDIPQRTKVDQYSNYTMCILPLVKLIKVKRDEAIWKLSERLLRREADRYSDPGAAAPRHHRDRHRTVSQMLAEREIRRVSDWSNETTSRRKIKLLEVHRPLSYRKLGVGVEQVSLFILKGTVISFFEQSAPDIESAILNRLSTEETILRDSCDPSILLQSIIDSIVDLAYPIVTAYRRRLEEIQANILTDAKMDNINELYLMLDELSLLKKNISPVTTLVNALRDHSKKAAISGSNQNSSDDLKKTASAANLRPIFISDVCELYLSDVADHTQSYTEDISIMESMANNLASMVFNMTAAQSNNSMSYLSLVSVIFLPLMFWSSYYGMNFERFGDLHEDVTYYWKVSISFTAVFIIIICWNYFMRFFKNWYKVAKRWRREYLIYREVKRRRIEKRAKRERLKRAQGPEPV